MPNRSHTSVHLHRRILAVQNRHLIARCARGLVGSGERHILLRERASSLQAWQATVTGRLKLREKQTTRKNKLQYCALEPDCLSSWRVNALGAIVRHLQNHEGLFGLEGFAGHRRRRRQPFSLQAPPAGDRRDSGIEQAVSTHTQMTQKLKSLTAKGETGTSVGFPNDRYLGRLPCY